LIRKEAANNEQAFKKEIQTLKYENKRQSIDLKDIKDRYEKTKQEYDGQFQKLKENAV
jgi:flagellar capping protein FliD